MVVVRLSALKASISVLNVLRATTGEQWREASNGGCGRNLGRLNMSCADASSVRHLSAWTEDSLDQCSWRSSSLKSFREVSMYLIFASGLMALIS